MKTIKALLIVCLTVLTVSVSAQQMKPHHQIIKDCSVCHTKENAVKGNEFVKPNNASCQSCHGSYEDLGKFVQNKIILILALTMVLELNARLAIKNISPALFTATTVMSLSTK